MIVTIHQPEHLPWLGFFDKARQSDLFVLLDSVQYRKNYFQNRNRIRSKNGISWVTVPVLTKDKSTQDINEVLINEQGSPRWREKCFNTIKQNYSKAPFWKEYADFMECLYSKTWGRLTDLNCEIIRFLIEALGLKSKIFLSSDMMLSGSKTDILVQICKQTNATSYLSGVSGKSYLDIEQFRRNGIDVLFQEFHHPVYPQLHAPFIPCLSVIDLLFNHGPSSLSIIQGLGVETLQTVFE